MGKLLPLWMYSLLTNRSHLSRPDVETLGELTLACCDSIPCCFSLLCRHVDDVGRWKSKELRMLHFILDRYD